ncbi:MAG: hypothetical protein ABMA25_24530 [Ilumatobacteraceae bacterium]
MEVDSKLAGMLDPSAAHRPCRLHQDRSGVGWHRPLGGTVEGDDPDVGCDWVAAGGVVAALFEDPQGNLVGDQQVDVVLIEASQIQQRMESAAALAGEPFGCRLELAQGVEAGDDMGLPEISQQIASFLRVRSSVRGHGPRRL